MRSGLDRLRLIIGWTIAVAWAASFALSAIDHTYSPDHTVDALMIALATFLLGPTITGRRNGNGS